jgi:hypothetical protein
MSFTNSIHRIAFDDPANYGRWTVPVARWGAIVIGSIYVEQEIDTQAQSGAVAQAEIAQPD